MVERLADARARRKSAGVEKRTFIKDEKVRGVVEDGRERRVNCFINARLAWTAIDDTTC